VEVVTEQAGKVVWRLTGDVVNVETVTNDVNHWKTHQQTVYSTSCSGSKAFKMPMLPAAVWQKIKYGKNYLFTIFL